LREFAGLGIPEPQPQVFHAGIDRMQFAFVIAHLYFTMPEVAGKGQRP
jgi:hypothetical protein